MWFAEFQFDGSNAPIGKLAKKFDLSFSIYPISLTEDKKRLLIYFATNVYGEEKNKKAAFKYMDKNPLIHYIERNNDFALVLFEEPKKTKPIYQHNIIHTKPIFISFDGKEIWSVASMNKENLISFYNVLKEMRNGRMIFIKNKKIKNISIAQIHPDLTNKQINAVKLAIEEGYYDVPRKTDVKSLAKKSNLAFSTYQTHLRKAESKLIPYSFQKVSR
ncbi:MAG: helix-turn-helix domain-containing protein [Candidatus Nanoarchaeia archaeon]